MPAWLNQYDWREPLWLVIALQPVLILLLRGVWRHQRLQRYVDPALQEWALYRMPVTLLGRLFSRDSAYIFAWILFGIAAAGPRLPIQQAGDSGTTGINIVLAIDVSQSMHANDVSPSRIRRARLEIEEFLAHAPGNRVGLIVFAARPHLYVPLTSDYRVLHEYLQSLDKLVLPTQGSAPASALGLAQTTLSSRTGQGAVILVTDGDIQADAEAAQLEEQASTLAATGITLSVLGAGSIEGDAIPLSGGDWLTDQGQPVVSRMNEPLLQQLARSGNGVYSPVRDDDSDWRALYDNGIKGLVDKSQDESDAQLQLWHELYTWFLLPGLVLLFLALYPYRLIGIAARQAAILCILLTAGLLAKPDAVSAGDNLDIERRAYLAFAKGEYDAAAEHYANLDTYNGHFGEGASHYRLGNYPAAIRQFSSAVLYAGTDHDRATALYNLANSYFRDGDYRTAIAVYRDAIHYRPDYNVARQNLEFTESLQREVDKRLEESILRTRAGRGPRSARAASGSEVTENNAISVDDSESTNNRGSSLPVLPGIDRASLERLLERGVEHAQLAASQPAANSVTPLDTGLLPGTDASWQSRVVQDDPAQLWKRIFEIEEGFAAELESPLPINGIPAW